MFFLPNKFFSVVRILAGAQKLDIWSYHIFLNFSRLLPGLCLKVSHDNFL
jgi:hypothetical protein